RVTIDNTSSKNTTLIKVDSANKKGSLLEVVQVLIDMSIIIKRAYISSDGEWFMDGEHLIIYFSLLIFILIVVLITLLLYSYVAKFYL
ncbi:ACT domain-containing protein ACR6, partial [Bienertia sinuspersici]